KSTPSRMSSSRYAKRSVTDGMLVATAASPSEHSFASLRAAQYTRKQREGEMKAPVVFICCILASGLAHGQAVSQISGTVTDSSGAAVVGVQITATQTDTDTKRTATTDDAGTYVLPNLPIGPYRID